MNTLNCVKRFLLQLQRHIIYRTTGTNKLYRNTNKQTMFAVLRNRDDWLRFFFMQLYGNEKVKSPIANYNL